MGVADSSPIAGHDWLIAKVRGIANNMLVKVIDAVAALQADARIATSEAGGVIEGDEPCLPHDSLH